MRQLSITDTGIVVGDPISGFKKLASGPLYDDTAAAEASLYQDVVRNEEGNLRCPDST
jgi:hypothetical protein